MTLLIIAVFVLFVIANGHREVDFTVISVLTVLIFLLTAFGGK